MSQVQLVRIAITPGQTDRLLEFLRGLRERRGEVRASLDAEGILCESLFVDRRPEGDRLYFYTRAEDLERAAAAFQSSDLPLDVATRELIRATWDSPEPLELVLDLEAGPRVAESATNRGYGGDDVALPQGETLRSIRKPAVGEYPPYSSIYLDLLEDDGRILEHLWENFLTIRSFCYKLPPEKLTYRYAPEKWTIKEILVHNIDDERIFTYRALRYARNDPTPLHGFDQDQYSRYSNANERSLDSIFEEYEVTRRSTIQLFQHLPEEAFMRSGSGIDTDGSIVNQRTVRGIAYHIAGHELRHFNVIKERYLGFASP